MEVDLLKVRDQLTELSKVIEDDFAPDIRVLPVLAAGPALVPEPLLSREAVLRAIDEATRSIDRSHGRM